MKPIILFIVFSFFMNQTGFGQSEFTDRTKKYPTKSESGTNPTSTTPKIKPILEGANIVFYEDFDKVSGTATANNYAFPNGWLRRNVDNKIPFRNYVNNGWDRVYDIFNRVDSVAISTSYYDPAGQADDWMWTPAITIPNASMKLFWNAKSEDPDFRDGYEVRVMTIQPTGGTGVIGNQVSASTLLFSIPEENTSWTPREISLSAYAGQTIYIGFRNNSNDKFNLLIDDVLVSDILTIPTSSVTILPGGFVNYTKLGGASPPIKLAKFTGITASTQNANAVPIPHGLDATKILSISVVVDLGPAGNVFENYTQTAGYQVGVSFENTNIYVWNSPTNSYNILNKPFKVMVTYEE